MQEERASYTLCGGLPPPKHPTIFPFLSSLSLSPRSSRPPKVFPKGKGRGKEKETYLDGGKATGNAKGGGGDIQQYTRRRRPRSGAGFGVGLARSGCYDAVCSMRTE